MTTWLRARLIAGQGAPRPGAALEARRCRNLIKKRSKRRSASAPGRGPSNAPGGASANWLHPRGLGLATQESLGGGGRPRGGPGQGAAGEMERKSLIIPEYCLESVYSGRGGPLRRSAARAAQEARRDRSGYLAAPARRSHKRSRSIFLRRSLARPRAIRGWLLG